MKTNLKSQLLSIIEKKNILCADLHIEEEDGRKVNIRLSTQGNVDGFLDELSVIEYDDDFVYNFPVKEGYVWKRDKTGWIDILYNFEQGPVEFTEIEIPKII